MTTKKPGGTASDSILPLVDRVLDVTRGVSRGSLEIGDEFTEPDPKIKTRTYTPPSEEDGAELDPDGDQPLPLDKLIRSE